MSRDVLAELASHAITLEEAESLYDAILESDRRSAVRELLGMTRFEWTAFGHGVGLEELARWRVDGWPRLCEICGKQVSPPEFGWLAREESSGSHRLVHVACL